MITQRLFSPVRDVREFGCFSNILTQLSRCGQTSHSIGKGPHHVHENSTNPGLPPSLYNSGNSLQRRESIRILEKLENGFKTCWRQRPRYLDVGCGTGNLTREILLNHCGGSSVMVGIDISNEMIDFARQHSQHARLSYDVLDIEMGDATGFGKKYGKFDRVYSFFCLNWVRNKARAFRNIDSLLGDDGQFLLVFVVRTDVREAWLDIAKFPRWKKYTAVSGTLTRFYMLLSRRRSQF